jgi:hypothetical protein
MQKNIKMATLALMICAAPLSATAQTLVVHDVLIEVDNANDIINSTVALNSNCHSDCFGPNLDNGPLPPGDYTPRPTLPENRPQDWQPVSPASSEACKAKAIKDCAKPENANCQRMRNQDAPTVPGVDVTVDCLKPQPRGTPILTGDENRWGEWRNRPRPKPVRRDPNPRDND